PLIEIRARSVSGAAGEPKRLADVGYELVPYTVQKLGVTPERRRPGRGTRPRRDDRPQPRRRRGRDGGILVPRPAHTRALRSRRRRCSVRTLSVTPALLDI